MNRALRRNAELPGVIAIAAVIATGVLLVAGFGVPVGAGLLVGLLIGLGAGLAISIRLTNRPRTGWTSYSTFGESAEAPLGANMPDHMRAMERVQRVDHGPLVRVIPGGATADASDVRVELIALEIRSTGAIGHITAAAAPPAMMTGSLAQAEVGDDRGTAYEVAGFGGNGSMDRMRYEIRFAPSPPPDATTLTIRIAAFTDPFPMPAGDRNVTGPWTLSVALHDQ